MKNTLVTIAVFTLLVFALGACTDEGPGPRDPNGAIPGDSGGETNSPGNDDDVGEDEGDAGDDADADMPQCEFDADENPADERYPCCFTDQDCHESGVDGADEMNCYYSECEEGGQGICRLAPEEGDCWSDDDCGDDQNCPYEEDADLFDCQDPTVFETAEQCIDD